jgi:hypothetical protein
MESIFFYGQNWFLTSSLSCGITNKSRTRTIVDYDSSLIDFHSRVGGWAKTNDTVETMVGLCLEVIKQANTSRP